MPSAEAKIYLRAEDHASPTLKKAQGGIGGLTKAIKAYGAEIGAVIGAVYSAIKIYKNLTAAWGEQEDAVMKLNAALQTTGIYTPELSGDIQDLASELQRATRYGDETTLAATGLLQSLGKLDSEGLQKAIPAVQDLAAGMGMDLEMAASLVGKTMGSTTNALSRYGIVIDTGLPKQEKLAQLIEQIEKSFGGLSEVMSDSFLGRQKRINNAFGDWKETMGAILAEQAEPMQQFLIDFLYNAENLAVAAKWFRMVAQTASTVFGFIGRSIKTNIDLIKALNVMWYDLGYIMQNALNPMAYTSGNMKKAILEIRDTWADTMNVMIEDWGTYISNQKEGWDEVVNYEIPRIKGALHDYQEKQKETEEQTEESLTAMQQYLRDYEYSWVGFTGRFREETDEQVAMTEEARAALERLSNQYEGFNDVVIPTLIDRMHDAEIAVEGLTEKQRELFEKLKRYAPIWTSFWSGMGAAAISETATIRDAFKQLFADLFMMMARDAAIRSAFAFARLQIGQGIKWAVASGMAAAAAGFVRSMAQGGTFETNGQPQLIMVGDNPSGRERVTVEPTTSTPQQSGPMCGDVYLNNRKVGKWISREIDNKNIPVSRRAISGV